MSKIVNYINLQNEKVFSYNNSIDENINLKDKKIPIISRLHYKDIISHSFKVVDSLSREELLVKSELKMYEDIGLDPTKSYKISYIKKSRVSEKEVLIEAFAVDKAMFTDKYNSPLKRVKHIDYLVLPFLSYQALYKDSIIEPKNDIFVYISEDEAFTTSFKDGQYISSKRIKSLNDMVNDLKNRNISITAQELKETIIAKGLNRDRYDLLHYDLHEYIVEVFSELFSKIKNLSLHNRNIYNFTQIDRVYIDLANSNIPELVNYVQSYLPETEILTFDFFKDNNVNSLDLLSILFSRYYLQESDDSFNMTFFEKKPPFYKSEVGKFILSTVAGIVMLTLYPSYQYYQILKLTQENEVLRSKDSKLTKGSKKLKKELKRVEQEISSLKIKKKDDLEKFNSLQNIANSLLELKSKDTKYTAMLLKINDALKNYHLYIDKISQADEHELDLELSSKEKNRDTIALLMKDLLNEGFSSVTSSEIVLSDDEFYKSIVKVKR